jgi:hypothetical protein
MSLYHRDMKLEGFADAYERIANRALSGHAEAEFGVTAIFTTSRSGPTSGTHAPIITHERAIPNEAVMFAIRHDSTGDGASAMKRSADMCQRVTLPLHYERRRSRLADLFVATGLVATS